MSILWQFEAADVPSDRVFVNLIDRGGCTAGLFTQTLFQGSSVPVLSLNVTSTQQEIGWDIPNTAFSLLKWVPVRPFCVFNGVSLFSPRGTAFRHAPAHPHSVNDTTLLTQQSPIC